MTENNNKTIQKVVEMSKGGGVGKNVQIVNVEKVENKQLNVPIS